MEDELVRLAVFLGSTYVAGRTLGLLQSSPLLGHIIAGALLGPPLADFTPVTDGLALAGLLGVQLTIIDAGLNTDMAALRALAPRATTIAVLGIALPIAGAMCVVVGGDVINGTYTATRSLRAGAAVGAAIAPTSLGVVGKLLAEAGELATPLGQLISIAAVVDDAFSLILLAVIKSLAGDSPSTWTLSKPVVLAFTFIAAALLVSALVPRMLGLALKPLPTASHSQVSLALLLATATALSWAANSLGTSPLLAGYLTGVAFAATAPELSDEPWALHVSPHVSWLFTLFFASTIGASIPLRVLFSGGALARGSLLVVAAIVGKLACGLAAPNIRDDGIVVAVAMQGRGEFGFLIAAEAFKLGIIDDSLYAVAVWGVLIPTLLTPILFPTVFRRRKARLLRIADGQSLPNTHCDE
jgi:Kef-type K+ transport system membrane component KefB